MADDEELSTWTALEAAVAAHAAASTDGGFLTDWVMTAAVVDAHETGITQYVTASSEGSPHRRLGLIERLRIRVSQQFTTDDD